MNNYSVGHFSLPEEYLTDTTFHPKTAVQPTHETSCTQITHQTTGNAEHNFRELAEAQLWFAGPCTQHFLGPWSHIHPFLLTWEQPSYTRGKLIEMSQHFIKNATNLLSHRRNKDVARSYTTLQSHSVHVILLTVLLNGNSDKTICTRAAPNSVPVTSKRL